MIPQNLERLKFGHILVLMIERELLQKSLKWY